jgi:hypothetical protein
MSPSNEEPLPEKSVPLEAASEQPKLTENPPEQFGKRQRVKLRTITLQPSDLIKMDGFGGPLDECSRTFPTTMDVIENLEKGFRILGSRFNPGRVSALDFDSCAYEIHRKGEPEKQVPSYYAFRAIRNGKGQAGIQFPLVTFSDYITTAGHLIDLYERNS